MSEMTLPSGHRIRNSNPGDLRPSTLSLGHGDSRSHNTEFYEWMGKKYLCFFQTAETISKHKTLAWKAAVLTTRPIPRAPAHL